MVVINYSLLITTYLISHFSLSVQSKFVMENIHCSLAKHTSFKGSGCQDYQLVVAKF